MPKRSNGFDKDPERARRAAIKANKNRGTFGRRMREWFKGNAHEFLSQSEAGKKLLDRIGAPKDATVEDVFRLGMLMHGVKGDMRAFNIAMDRAFGKPSQKIKAEHTGSVEVRRIEYQFGEDPKNKD